MPLRKIDSEHNQVFDLNKMAESPAKKRQRQKSLYEKHRYKDPTSQKAIHTKKWQNTRREIIIADGGECQRCLMLFGWHTVDNLQVHHIKPRTQFPELTYENDNLVTLCKTCNLVMGENGIDFAWTPEMRFRKVDEDIHL